MNKLAKSIGQRIRNYRTKLGLTQENLARHLVVIPLTSVNLNEEKKRDTWKHWKNFLCFAYPFVSTLWKIRQPKYFCWKYTIIVLWISIHKKQSGTRTTLFYFTRNRQVQKQLITAHKKLLHQCQYWH